MKAGETLSFRASAHDVDLPENTLRYQLAAAPIGASISTEGRFTWRASVAQSGATHSIEIRVQDDGQPPKESSKSFTVAVAPLLPATIAYAPRPQSDGEFRFMIQGPVGPDYVVMRSDNLRDWTDISTNLVPTLPFEFVEPIALRIPHRFFRVRLQP